jgi:hypothetical protein
MVRRATPQLSPQPVPKQVPTPKKVAPPPPLQIMPPQPQASPYSINPNQFSGPMAAQKRAILARQQATMKATSKDLDALLAQLNGIKM